MKKMFLGKVGVLAIAASMMLASCGGGSSTEVTPKFEDVSKEEALYEILEFVNDNIPFYIATIGTNNNVARLRPFSFMMEYEGKLYFVTSEEKQVSKQLKKNPYMEICTCSPQGDFIRLRGKAVLSNDLKAKEKSFEVAPYFGALYESPSNPTMELYAIEEGECSFNTSSGVATKYYKLY